MFITLAVSSLFVASVLATADPQPYLLPRNDAPDFSINNGFGLMVRQANGYAPSHGPTCRGGGRTCESACGPTYLQCPSKTGIHCFDTAKQQSCCSDGNGYACNVGYYCSNTASKRTWCCPNGMDLTQCAAAYSLTEVLQSVTTAAVSSTDTASVPTATSVTTTAKLSSSTATRFPSGVAKPTISAFGTGGFTPTPTDGVAQFTGNAAPKAGLGGAVGGLVLAAGALLL